MLPQEGDLIRCPSCGALDSGNYCSQCGKSLYEEGTGWYHELFHELMPISKVFDVLRTFQNMLAHHKIFFSEVKEKNWSNKIKPIPFLITCIALMLLGATFFGSSSRSITWFDMLSYSGDDISEKEIDLFFEVLNVNLTEDDVSDEAFFSGSSTTSKGISAQTGSIEAHKVIAFIGNKGAVESNENYEKLADRFDKIIEDLQKTKSYVEPITSMLMPAALVIALWFVGSNIIKTSMVDRQMSFNILCYILAIVWVATEMVDIK